MSIHQGHTLGLKLDLGPEGVTLDDFRLLTSHYHRSVNSQFSTNLVPNLSNNELNKRSKVKVVD